MAIGQAPKHILPLDLEDIAEANEERQKHWGGSDKIDLSFLGMEIGEEAGEVQGALKKVIRHRLGVQGNKGKTEAELMGRLEDEIGDLFINLSRLCNAMGLDASACVRSAFNKKSDDLGIEVYL